MSASSLSGNITMPAEDRNRTSPLPYGGHRFEFRAVGSSQVTMCDSELYILIDEILFIPFRMYHW